MNRNQIHIGVQTSIVALQSLPQIESLENARNVISSSAYFVKHIFISESDVKLQLLSELTLTIKNLFISKKMNLCDSLEMKFI